MSESRSSSDITCQIDPWFEQPDCLFKWGVPRVEVGPKFTWLLASEKKHFKNLDKQQKRPYAFT